MDSHQPPKSSNDSRSTSASAPPSLTPEQRRTIEINRVRAKALREQKEAEARNNGSVAAGQKRPFSAVSLSSTANNKPPSSVRDGRAPHRPLDEIRPARNFTKYVDYDFSKMTDTKGGFLTAEDDPHNKALHAGGRNSEEGKPPHMTLKEWERQQLMESLRRQKAGPFEPSLSVLDADKRTTCRECGSPEIDWKWEETFKCSVCNACKEKLPEKYSLLTKTEAKEDYLLTDPELKDEDLLPHLERPNPHKATWNNMMLYLRCQVEEYAFSAKKWGSPEALDAEFERRENEKKRRRDVKFKTKLNDLKKRTRVEAYRRNRQAGGASGAGGTFGDEVGSGGKHVHQWGRAVENADDETGIGVKTCIECGMEVEELEF